MLLHHALRAINKTAPSGGWDLSNAIFNGVPPAVGIFSVSTEESTPQGIFFKPDGTKMYVTGGSGDDVNEYNLSTAWNISTASFVQVFSFGAQETSPTGIFFRPDGTKMYIIGTTGDDVNEFNLSTAWNVSTASFVQVFSVATQETSPADIFFKPDGTKMYVLGSSGDDVNEYNLSTAWNVSTASYVQVFSIGAQETNPAGIFFRDDGTKMYVIGSTGDDVNEYNLSTAWNVSTASYVQVFSIGAQENVPAGIFFKPDGTKMYVVGSSRAVYEYNLSTAWNVSTASYAIPSSEYHSIAPQESIPKAVFFRDDGTKMYVSGIASTGVNEYNLSTAWEVSTASFVQVFSVSAQDNSPESISFKPDGTKMYMVGSTFQNVNEYNLSTAWNVSTASYVQNRSLTAQETSPTGIFFKPDGTKMYVIGLSGDDVNEYNLSTAWNISTASFVQVFSVAAQETSPAGIFFKPDGTKMYVLGDSGNDVNEYNLSTAWNVSTASFVQVFSVATQETSPADIFFKPDGTKMYVIGSASDAIWAYDL